VGSTVRSSIVECSPNNRQFNNILFVEQNTACTVYLLCRLHMVKVYDWWLGPQTYK